MWMGREGFGRRHRGDGGELMMESGARRER